MHKIANAIKDKKRKWIKKELVSLISSNLVLHFRCFEKFKT